MVEIIVDESLFNIRLDKAISTLFNELSRTYIAKCIFEGKCLVNNKKEKSSYKLKKGDVINIDLEKENDISYLEKEDIPIEIVYEDDDIAIINKPQGMVVHPGNGNKNHTLANALIFHFSSLSSLNGETRPGIVHRIDKDTAGLLVVAKNDKAHRFLSHQLENHTLKREYIALCKGVIKENKGHIDLPLARDKNNRLKMCVDKSGKQAITDFEVIERFNNYTLVKCSLKTGRTHQIRVHMAYISHPIDSDPLYNKKSACKLWDKGQLLCAVKLTLVHPTTKKEMEFNISLPPYFENILSSLRKNK